MGFGDMPYMVYKHTDINRHHMHIVALRVRTDGSCISDKNNFYRSKEITRELERKYGLKTAEREKVNVAAVIKKTRAMLAPVYTRKIGARETPINTEYPQKRSLYSR